MKGPTMEQPGPEIPLSESHRRAITIALRMLDQMLCEFEEYARGRERHSVFYQERNSLTDPQRRALQGQIEEMRKVMADIKSRLALENEADPVAKRIWAKSAAFWEVLVETTTKHLARYGKPAQELGEFLDPRLTLLIRHLEGITRLADPRAADRTSAAGGPEP